jgi:hypothetical protein
MKDSLILNQNLVVVLELIERRARVVPVARVDQRRERPSDAVVRASVDKRDTNQNNLKKKKQNTYNLLPQLAISQKYVVALLYKLFIIQSKSSIKFFLFFMEIHETFFFLFPLSKQTKWQEKLHIPQEVGHKMQRDVLRNLGSVVLVHQKRETLVISQLDVVAPMELCERFMFFVTHPRLPKRLPVSDLYQSPKRHPSQSPRRNPRRNQRRPRSPSPSLDLDPDPRRIKLCREKCEYKQSILITYKFFRRLKLF